jgi:transposase InsO family protein
LILSLVAEAVERGARQSKACETLGLDRRTVQRWKYGPSEDQRRGPRRNPSNKMSVRERRHLLEVANRPENRDLPPSQIVPRLADNGEYVGSESTMYRALREAKQLKHRGRARPRTSRRPEPHVATGSREIWSWDITYLKSPVRGMFFYLYLIMDLWSRKIVGFEVYDRESPDLAAELVRRTCMAEEIDASALLVLHSDNGGPMKGATMLATLDRLGVRASFSRPQVSDDNPFSEALFRTLKYRPEYPDMPFASIEHAREWVRRFVRWYNEDHRHSSIRFVTPAQRHNGNDLAILEQRQQVYERARSKHPERWTGQTRDWSPITEVELNPSRVRRITVEEDAA